jgi:hypothetical protein
MGADLKPVLLKKDAPEECKWIVKNNYTDCGILITEKFPYSVIDHTRVKYVAFADPYMENGTEQNTTKEGGSKFKDGRIISKKEQE